ncbi:recombinase family protein [Mesorhizobium sp. PAMC28654]|uniref:recombinase family protein n=1 Tax=Mesorhizobium sp. PAMC28654 TaxID=2880934 RepID=UPI001D0A9414|nr:recombinase family protein [Mesorhizobium sp. PAMC28654]UDL87297.1 recombinase family protein [Mesorhizobium sp. PAMC28654]
MAEPAPKRPRAYSYIRMSTDIQLKGDSRRRQLELSEAYAKEHDLQLVEEFQLEDLGVSAFRGANLSEASSLGRFLQSVKDGEVPVGSYLLVESLDRLSRQNVFTSLSLFTDLIKAGVVLVTLVDGQVYTADKTDFSQLVVSLAIMSRAHEESQTKSRRLSAAWTNKRQTADHQKLTALAPAWLNLSTDRKSFVLDGARSAVVRSILEDAAAGLGSYAIARRLNARRIVPFGRSKGWQTSYVTKIMTNRAVIGEYQPHMMLDGRRVPTGAPIPNYFPPVVDEELYLRVLAGRSQRRVGGAGRKGNFVSNLFSGLARCAYCDSQMHFINKGSLPKGGSYLVCDNAHRGLGCDNMAWRYDDFEASFLTFVEEADLRPLLQAQGDSAGPGGIDQRAQALEGRILQLEKERDRTFRLLLDQDMPSEFLKGELAKLQRDIEMVSVDHAGLVEQRRQLEAEVASFYASRDEIQDLVAQMRAREGNDRYRLRTQVAGRLKSLISVINVATLGDRRPYPENLIELTKEAHGLTQGGQNGRSQGPDIPDRSARHFDVFFKDGTTRLIRPRPTDPVIGESQVYRSIYSTSR